MTKDTIMQHPNDRHLQHFVAGQLKTDHEAIISNHLAQCPECAKRVSELERKPLDPLMQNMQAVAADGMESSESAGLTQTADCDARSGRKKQAGSEHFTDGDLVGGNLRLEKRLGCGGMGEAWKASDLAAGRDVVVKLVPSEVRNVEFAMGQVRETFQKVHALQHQHICPVIGLNDDPAFGVYLVMKFINGKTLDVYRKEYVAEHGRFPLSESIRILWDVARALDYSHERKVLHRDVKPQNIMLSPEDGVQLIDFGLAAEIRSSMMQISETPMDIAGTRPYMAPEQWRGRLQDGRTDQYALAVMAYELIAGRQPFLGDDIAVLRECVLNDEPEPIAGIPAHINAALLKAMSKKREDRFSDCRSFVKAMAEKSKADKADVEPPPFLGPMLEKTPRFRPGVRMIVLCCLAVCALCFGLYGFFSGKTSLPRTDMASTIIPVAIPEEPTEPSPIESDSPPFVAVPVPKVEDSSSVVELIAPPQGDDPAATMSTQVEPVENEPFQSDCKDIFEAAQRGTTDDVRYFVDKDVSVNTKDRSGNTPLHVAAQSNPDVEVLKYLVSRDADIDARNNNGDTTLHMAAQSNFNVEILEYLVLHGVGVNARNSNGDTPLHVAAWNPDVEVLQYLVFQSTDVNVKNNVGNTPLHDVALSNSNEEVVKHLVSRGGRVDTRNNAGQTALDIANTEEKKATLRTMGGRNGTGTPSAPLSPSGCRHLFEAVTKGTVPDVEHFLENGADVNAKRIDGWTPLHEAAQSNANTEVMKYLVSQGADIHAKTNWGTTPLHEAARSNANVEILEYLVSQGADAKEEGDYRFTALHYAAQFNANAKVLEYLVSQGTDVNAKNLAGNTPLHTAARFNPRIEILKYLVNQKADINAKNNLGQTPLDVTPGALHKREAEAQKKAVLRAAKGWDGTGAVTIPPSPSGYEDMLEAAARGTIQDIEHFFKNDVTDYAKGSFNVIADGGTHARGNSFSNVKKSRGLMALLYEAAKSNPDAEVLKYLVSQGADINETDNPHHYDGRGTVLHEAARFNSNVEVVKYIVSQSSDIHAKDHLGVMPLHYAARSNSNVDILKYLVSQGADVNSRSGRHDMNDMPRFRSSNTATGPIPLQEAARYNSNVEVLEYLVSQGTPIDMKDGYGNTLLHDAARSNSNVEVLRYLVSQGAEINAKNNSGRTPSEEIGRESHRWESRNTNETREERRAREEEREKERKKESE